MTFKIRNTVFSIGERNTLPTWKIQTVSSGCTLTAYRCTRFACAINVKRK